MQQFKDTFTEESNVSTVGRIAAGGVGTTLLVKGLCHLKKPTAKSCFQLAAGAYLIFMGVTGFSPVKALLKPNPPKG